VGGDSLGFTSASVKVCDVLDVGLERVEIEVVSLSSAAGGAVEVLTQVPTQIRVWGAGCRVSGT